MKNLASNLAVTKTTITVFESKKQKGKQWTESTRLCLPF